MKTEAEIRFENTRPEGYISDRELVIPSLLPFLSAEQLTRPILKRNETHIETDPKKINQKRIEAAFESAILIDTEKLLEEWSPLIRDEDDMLIDCLVVRDANYNLISTEAIPMIFKKFYEMRDSARSNGLEEIPVPVFGKPNSLKLAFEVYQRNYDTLRTLSQN